MIAQLKFCAPLALVIAVVGCGGPIEESGTTENAAPATQQETGVSEQQESSQSLESAPATCFGYYYLTPSGCMALSSLKAAANKRCSSNWTGTWASVFRYENYCTGGLYPTAKTVVYQCCRTN